MKPFIDRRTAFQKAADKIYNEDLKKQIDVNRKDLDNYVNIEYDGVIIVLTQEEYKFWQNPKYYDRAEKRAHARDIKKSLAAGEVEYFDHNGIKLMRKVVKK